MLRREPELEWFATQRDESTADQVADARPVVVGEADAEALGPPSGARRRLSAWVAGWATSKKRMPE